MFTYIKHNNSLPSSGVGLADGDIVSVMSVVEVVVGIGGRSAANKKQRLCFALNLSLKIISYLVLAKRILHFS